MASPTMLLIFVGRRAGAKCRSKKRTFAPVLTMTNGENGKAVVMAELTVVANSAITT